MEETKKYTKNNVVISFLIGVLVGFGGYYLYDNIDVIKNIKNRDNKEDTGGRAYNDDALPNDINASNEYSQNIIMVKDQPAGFRVIVDSVTLVDGGWVAIREDNEGEPGNILGAQKFEDGTNTGEVELLRNTVEGGTYYAVLIADDGDGEFDHKKDSPIIDNLGDPVLSQFKVIRIR